jgi:hypothetical protein
MQTQQPLSQTAKPAVISPIRAIGVWMSVILVIYILFNAVRAVVSPTDFAASYGTPLADPANDAFVLVYAIRALFLGVFGLVLLLRRDWRALALFALVGAIMPVGDAALVALKGGAAGTVIRHMLTAVFLVATWYLLQRWMRNAVASKA